MEQINNELRTVRSKIIKGINKEFSIQDANEAKQELIEINEKLLDQYIAENKDIPMEVEQKIDYYNNKINNYIKEKTDFENQSTTSVSKIQNQQINMTNQNNSYKLEDIPKFSGCYLDWYTYKAIAKPIIINGNLDEIRAKSYLLQTLNESAKRSIMRLINSNVKVNEIWNHLEKIYEDERKLVIKSYYKLHKCPFVKNEKDINSLRIVKYVAESVLCAAESSKITHHQNTMLQILANKFYHQAKINILSESKTFEEAVDRISDLYDKRERFIELKSIKFP